MKRPRSLPFWRQFVERRREALADLEVQLATMPTEPAQHAESSAMNSPERLPSETHKPITGYSVGALAVLTLSLPFADSRHCASRHDGRRVHRRVLSIAALTLTGLFVLSVY